MNSVSVRSACSRGPEPGRRLREHPADEGVQHRGHDHVGRHEGEVGQHHPVDLLQPSLPAADLHGRDGGQDHDHQLLEVGHPADERGRDPHGQQPGEHEVLHGQQDQQAAQGDARPAGDGHGAGRPGQREGELRQPPRREHHEASGPEDHRPEPEIETRVEAGRRGART